MEFETFMITLEEKLSYAKDTRTECTEYAENAIAIYLYGCEAKNDNNIKAIVIGKRKREIGLIILSFQRNTTSY